MALSVVDLYRDILPKTNCKDCGYSTCLAFASMVVSEKLPLDTCPHLEPEIIERCRTELDEQYAAGKWLKRDMAQDAFEWAREKASSMDIADLPERIGGQLLKSGDKIILELPYFTGSVLITNENITKKDGSELTRWEKVFLYNHIAQGGSSFPTGKWKGLIEFPNTVSKIKSMVDHVELPLIERFKRKTEELIEKATEIGGIIKKDKDQSSGISILFCPLPKVPIKLMFWDISINDDFGNVDFDPEVKLLFDETIIEHLDIESIMFLSERLKQLLCDEP
ncbi:MAG: DUF3786 domain-containing protein [Desulfobacterales bacterium]|jgi:hypothetical protein|nr:DUF3786 domain-containing protein [Desulfobacteraceae bacterium]MBT4365194.1 DUF3786 domain-containing protein [Desulfobacteraceae bacterium]MBT7085500.1 DUF3786 domain-containing protein [Desulfobacterales bacterium]MBT7696007.1 DUF3786 domain-containing protein [Desulfobacterales bacterium]